MTFNEAKEFINGIYESMGNVFNPTDEQETTLKEISALTHIEKSNCGCTTAWHDTIMKMQLYFRNNTEFITCNYEMARGKVFIVDAVAYTQVNLTDEVAEWLLENNPVASKFITKLNNNTTEQVETPTQAQETPTQATIKRGRKKKI